jgi:hypothetical protein
MVDYSSKPIRRLQRWVDFDGLFSLISKSGTSAQRDRGQMRIHVRTKLIFPDLGIDFACVRKFLVRPAVSERGLDRDTGVADSMSSAARDTRPTNIFLIISHPLRFA